MWMSDVPLHIHAHHPEISSSLCNSSCIHRKVLRTVGWWLWHSWPQALLTHNHPQGFHTRLRAALSAWFWRTSSQCLGGQAERGREATGRGCMKPPDVLALCCHFLRATSRQLFWASPAIPVSWHGDIEPDWQELRMPTTIMFSWSKATAPCGSAAHKGSLEASYADSAPREGTF